MPQQLSELNTEKRLKILAYGHSGTGKTIFACGFPLPIYVADFDGKISSARNYYSIKDSERLKQISFDSFQPKGKIEIDKPFARYNTELVNLERLAAGPEPFPYKTVVLDSVTTYLEQMTREVMRQKPQTKRYDKDTPVLQDYGIVSSHFKLYLSRILQLPCNVVVTAHIGLTKDELTGEVTYGALLTPKLAPMLPILFEEVYRTYTELKDGKTLYMAQTQASRKYSARCQIQGLSNPTELSYTNIAKFLKGE